MGSKQGLGGNQDPVEPFLWLKLLNRAFQQGIMNQQIHIDCFHPKSPYFL